MQIKRHIQINTIKSRLTLVRNYTKRKNDNNTVHNLKLHFEIHNRDKVSFSARELFLPVSTRSHIAQKAIHNKTSYTTSITEARFTLQLLYT